MSEEKCENCRFWRWPTEKEKEKLIKDYPTHIKQKRMGFCKKIELARKKTGAVNQPFINPQRWFCGKFKPKEK